MKNSYPLSKAINFSLRGIATKPVRFVVTILLFVFCLSFMGWGLCAADINVDAQIVNIYRSIQQNNVFLQGHTLDENRNPREDFGDRMEGFIAQNANYSFDKIYQKSDMMIWIDEITPNTSCAYYENGNRLNGFLHLTEAGLGTYGYTLFSGTMPVLEYDICITLYQYQQFLYNGYRGRVVESPADILGKTIAIGRTQQSFRVVGIVDTKLGERYEPLKKDRRYMSKEEFAKIEPLQQLLDSDLRGSAHGVLFVSDLFVKNQLEGNLVYCATQQTNPMQGFPYFASNVTEEASDFIAKNSPKTKLFLGSDTLNAGECILPKSMLNELVEYGLGQSGMIFQDEAFADYIAQNPNIALMLDSKKIDKFELSKAKNLKIAGYYEDFTVQKLPNGTSQMVPNGLPVRVLLHASSFEPKIKADYCVDRLMTTLLPSDQANQTLVQQVQQSGVLSIGGIVDNDALYMRNMTKTYMQFGLIVGAVLGVFTMLMMFNFISATIAAKTKEIGVMRALGVSNASVYKIFLLESLFTSLIAYFLCLPGTYLLTIIINAINPFLLGNLAFVTLKLLPSVLLFAVAVGIALVGSFLPIFKLTHQKPMDIIRN